MRGQNNSFKQRLQSYLPAISLLLIIPIWQLVCSLFEFPPYILPSPTMIFDAFVQVESARWVMHLWATLRVALFGFILSLCISIPLAMMMVSSKYLSKTLYPLLVVIQSTPVVAIAPLLITMFGSGEGPRLAITCLITFFPLVVSATTGMLSTPPELIDLSRSLRAARYKEIFYIRLPYALPHIFSGMKVAITLAIIGAVVAEFVAAEQGLGYFIQFSTSFFKVPQAFAALIFLAVVSLILFKTVYWVQKYFFAWTLNKEKS
ncbi:ABC transporter permease [Gayadomonas joobiniege]|uniref:ABC transporter permease n=1 Tax=Gayadomonas joobiniege TaxID=1234606 RepID=UPI000372E850|nr:ABC transporter permease [Gayadomonas joobiniege]